MNYIALLRGINVGANNRIKMADLRRLFEEIGFSQVQTYIQSGNVLFMSDSDEKTVKARIEEEFRRVFGFAVFVILRTVQQMEHIVRDCLFSAEEVEKAESFGDGESLYVALLHAPLTEGEITRLASYANEAEQFRVDGRDIYLLFYHSIRDSKLAAVLSKVAPSSTVRNWKTMQKLAELASGVQP